MANKHLELYAHFVDIEQRQTYPAQIIVNNGRISSIQPTEKPCQGYIMAGFVDAHIHIESAMILPTAFAAIALQHGTVGTISDPHEIANVLGKAGVDFMIANGKKSNLKFHFGAPSCVPATSFETAGAEVDLEDLEQLLASEDINYLAEMMNWPGVLNNDPLVLAKIALAQRYGKPIDGHAPGLVGEQALNYISKGISTDHECFSYEEGLFKLQNGMKVIVREGSAAKNFDALAPLISEHYPNMMFCSDDKHPDDLLLGHINQLVARAVAAGYDMYSVLQMACINPVRHYNMSVGTMRVGDWADFILLDNLQDFIPTQTYINGELVAQRGSSNQQQVAEPLLNNFNIGFKQSSDFALALGSDWVNVIEVLDRQLITNKIQARVQLQQGQALPNIADDILKICVVNRYHNAPVAVAFCKNFGLKTGAIASSVAHDSHNIIAVGVNDASICRAVNLIIAQKGGLSAVTDTEEKVLALPIAGLMSPAPAETVAAAYTELLAMSRAMGSGLASPYMSLSFMALLVIPQLKLSDKGLFDGLSFSFCEVEASR